MSLVIKPSVDKQEIMQVLGSPGVWENIGGKEIAKEDFRFETDGDIYFLIGKSDNSLVGCFIAEKIGDDTWEVHTNVMTGFRRKYATEFTKRCIDWVWAKTGADQLVAEIPGEYMNVAQFAMRLGFKQIRNNSNNNLLFELRRSTK